MVYLSYVESTYEVRTRQIEKYVKNTCFLLGGNFEIVQF